MRAQIQELQSRVSAPTAAQPALPAGLKPVPTAQKTEAEINQEIERRAAEKAKSFAAAQSFNERCNSVVKEGGERYGGDEFNKRVGNLIGLVDKNDPDAVKQYQGFLSSALETDDPARVLYELGDDLEKFQNLLDKPVAKQVAEMTKIALKDDAAVTKATKPIVPVGKRTASVTEINPDDASSVQALSMDEWAKRRNAQIAQRKEGGNLKNLR